MARTSRIDARAAVREVLATLGKAALAVLVFCLLFFGFQRASMQRANAVLASLPLPDETVQSDCAIWFVGSSSMSRWSTLQRDMSPWSTHNRSIGGATLPEISRRFLNEQDPQRPQAIVFYAGENDLANGRPVKATVAAFRDFLAAKTKRLGDVPVLFVSVKPSPIRWEQRPAQAAFNDAVRDMARQHPDLHFVDTVPKLMRDGRPGPFYVEDGLHLNEDGYHVLASALRPALEAELPPGVVRRCLSPRQA